ncbi:hypothetical protein CKAH01_09053 [Colletotrichum kahawae]|uniref:Uncharacterized protein n=1 Tax=Colletotrichum kahawae TaxID=34407 RepID=A0AAD9Y126_COLKA|nr:hypothetical protein CKAH01_09053 [Colletotrichum kahawae]
MQSLQLRKALPVLLAALAMGTSVSTRQSSSLSLLGPINLGIPSIDISSISISLVTFADEVIDISGISIFGNVNDGTVNCTSTTDETDASVVGPVSVPAEGATQINLSLITFGDEVVDFSNVAIFGDVNDVGCD